MHAPSGKYSIVSACCIHFRNTVAPIIDLCSMQNYVIITLFTHYVTTATATRGGATVLKVGTNSASEAGRNCLTPTFWLVGDKILLR